MLAKIFIELMGRLIKNNSVEKLCDLNTKVNKIDVKKA